MDDLDKDSEIEDPLKATVFTDCNVSLSTHVLSHAASSGFLASPNPIAAISAARAAGKGLL